MADRKAGFATRAIHVGQGPDPATGAVVQPIHLATTFKQTEVGQHQGWEYSRSGNPTRDALEECYASLENGSHAFAYASGLAAEMLVSLLLDPGDHVVFGYTVYGGTYRLFERVLKRYGLTFTACDTSNAQAVSAAITSNTKMLWLESPTNPLLELVDIRELSGIARAKGVLTCVDNTFASPYLQRPLEHGADLVVHSSTKYLGGHSDVVGGCVVTSNAELVERLRFDQNAVGAIPSPFDCWLLLRGIKTLAVRMQQHCENAWALAEFLQATDGVRQVYYPGLPSHPGHELVAKQMGGLGGGMLSFELQDEATALNFLKSLKVITLAESLGAVESLAEHPWRMTHSSMPEEIRKKAAISDSLIRLSVGIEDIADLVADIEQALTAARA
jgi:cystathionine gamma-synthase/cystathionine gamma-lyase